MKFYHEPVVVQSKKKVEIVDVTKQVREVQQRSGASNGLVNVWAPHTSAGVSVNESSKVLSEDVVDTLTRLVPPNAEYGHRDNAHAHILSILTKPGAVVTLRQGKLELGAFQSILLFEFDGPRERTVNVTVMGE